MNKNNVSSKSMKKKVHDFEIPEFLIGLDFIFREALCLFYFWIGTTISDMVKHMFQNKNIYSNSFQELLPHCNSSLCCELFFPRKRWQKINLFIQICGKCPRKLISAPVNLFSCKKFYSALSSWSSVHLQSQKKTDFFLVVQALPLPRKNVSELAEQQIFPSFPCLMPCHRPQYLDSSQGQKWQLFLFSAWKMWH